MNRRVVYHNARVLDSDIDMYGFVITDGGLIEAVGQGNPPEIAGAMLDCGGKLLIPGLLDIHVHFRDPGMTAAEDITSGSLTAAASGVTTVVCQPNTTPDIDSVMMVEYIKQQVAMKSCIDVKMYGATTLGRQGDRITDIPALYKAGVCGFTDDGSPTHSAYVMRQALAYSRELNVPIAQHAEDKTLSCNGSMHEGSVSFLLGEKGIPALSESVVVARDLMIAQQERGFYHVLHVSSRDSLRLIERAKNDGIRVTCEVTPHHFTLTHEDLLDKGTHAKMNPPLRTADDVNALLAGLKSGVIDCIASDHAPHIRAKKECSLSCAAFGIIGLETLLPLSLRLYYSGLLSLQEVVRLLTRGPADLIHAYDRGSIRKGMRADFALIDLDSEYLMSHVHSKSRNTPFEGERMRGRVLKTIYGGNVVWDLDKGIL